MAGKQTFGEAVAAARTLLGITTSGAAGMLQMTEPLLADIESGVVEPNEVLRDIFEKAYDLDLSWVSFGPREHVERQQLSYDEDAGILTVDNLGVRFRVGVDDNDVLLRGFSSAVRRLRCLTPDVPINLRADDMPVLAQLIDLTDSELDARARFWFGQDREDGQSFAMLMRLSNPPKPKAA